MSLIDLRTTRERICPHPTLRARGHFPSRAIDHICTTIKPGLSRTFFFAGSHDGKMQNFITPAAFDIHKREEWNSFRTSSIVVLEGSALR